MSEIRPGAPLNGPSRTPALQIAGSMLDALPSPDRINSKEHPVTKQYSIFLPVEQNSVSTYVSLMGNVIETGRFSPNRVDLSISEQLPGIIQIPIGSFVKTIETPNNLGGLAYRALLPTGIEALSRGQSVIGTSYRGRERHNYIAIFEQPFPDIPQEKRDDLGARYSTTRFLLDADNQLVSALARQDFTEKAPQTEMNRFFHTIDGNNPTIEDLLHRFGSFDLRLLFLHYKNSMHHRYHSNNSKHFTQNV